MMYTVSSKSSKLVATRRGISQNYESFRDIGKKSEDGPELSLPRPVFQTPPPRKYHNNHHHNQDYHSHMKTHMMGPQGCRSPQHEEIVKFVHDTWCTVAVDSPYDAPSSPDSAISINSSSSQLTPSGSSSMSKSSSVCSSTSSSSSSGGFSTPALIYYTDKPDPRLQDFKPFDLEAWWGRRLYHNITKSL